MAEGLWDVAISHTIAYNHGIIIGLSSAETLKNEEGSLLSMTH